MCLLHDTQCRSDNCFTLYIKDGLFQMTNINCNVFVQMSSYLSRGVWNNVQIKLMKSSCKVHKNTEYSHIQLLAPATKSDILLTFALYQERRFTIGLGIDALYNNNYYANVTLL